MTSVSFGGAGGSAFTGYNPVTSGAIGLPTGRAMANGTTYALLLLTSVLTAGSGSASLAGSGGSWSRGGSTPGYNGVSGAGYVLVNGGTANLSISHTGTMYFGRAGGGTTSDGVTNWTGIIGGSYDWLQAPSEPTLNTVTSATTGVLSYNFSGSGDNGGAAISTYRVEYATNAGFSGSSYVETTTGAGNITGLTPGVTYWVRVAARNGVTDAAGTLGPYSATGSVQVLGGTRVGIAGSWVDCSLSVGINGEWVPVQLLAGRAGAWVGLTS
jgi:hypothetical protein